MPAIILRCRMQDNGFVDVYGPLTLEQCREMFECNIDGPECTECPILEVKIDEDNG